MSKDVVEARALEDYKLFLRFEDGVEGTVDVAKLIRFTGVFEPLRERSNFVQVGVNKELGTVCWPRGGDLDPDVLYSLVTGRPIPSPETLLGAQKRA